MGLIVNCGAEAEETHGAKNNDHKNKDETELRLVNAVVELRKLKTEVIVQRTRDDFANNSQNEGAERDETRRFDKNDAVHNTEDDNPGQGSTVDEEAPEHGGIEE
ncbi:MAG: hypothetical protein Q9160_003970 [Pyrenula sp. 1 TL-2023]